MRGHPRTPLAKAKATGRTSVNPGRFKNRTEPKTAALGDPSPHLNEVERKVWEAFKREVPWLTEADRATVDTACHLRAKLWLGTISDAGIGKLLSCLSRMGATPADRSRIHAPSEQAPDAADEFLQ